MQLYALVKKRKKCTQNNNNNKTKNKREERLRFTRHQVEFLMGFFEFLFCFSRT